LVHFEISTDQVFAFSRAAKNELPLLDMSWLSHPVTAEKSNALRVQFRMVNEASTLAAQPAAERQSSSAMVTQ
jgi:hypothetical protein